MCNPKSRSALIAAVALAVASTAPAAAADVCQPGVKKIHRLGTPGGSFSKKALETREEAAAFFDGVRTEVEALMAQKGMSDLVEPFYAALHSGEGVSERGLPAGEIFDWMVYRRGGEARVGSGPYCLDTDQVYDAFEVDLVEEEKDCSTHRKTIHTFVIPKICANLAFLERRVQTEPVPPVKGPTCRLRLTRTCGDDSMINVDASGSSPGVVVSMGGDTVLTVGSGSSSTSIADPDPSSPATLVARGRSDDACAQPPTCEAEATIDACPAPPPPPMPDEPAFEPYWTVRGFAARFDVYEEFDSQSADGTERSYGSVGNGTGFGGNLEYRMSERVGIEGGLLWAPLDAYFVLDVFEEWASDDDEVGLLALTFGPNFHLTPDRAADFYIGPFIGYAQLDDASFTLNLPDLVPRQISTDFDNELVYGAQLGLDIPFGSDSRWAFHVGALYMALGANDSNVDLDLDPLIGTIGLAYDF